MATKNYVLGRGKLYVDLMNSSGVLTGERYLGNTPGMTLAVESASLEHRERDSALAEVDDEIITSINRRCRFTVDDVQPETLAMWLIGSKASESTTAATVTNEVPGDLVYKDRYIQLGVSSTHPAGVRGISATGGDTVVKDSTGTTTYTAGATSDYTVDATNGRLYIPTTTTIVEGTTLKVTYKTTAVSWEQVKADDLSYQKAALRYIADNAEGTNRDLFIPLAHIKPDGDLAFKGEDWMAMGFLCQILKRDSSTAAVYINGKAA